MHTIESSIQKYRIESLLFVIFKAIRRSLITKTRIFKSHAISIIIIFHLSLDIIAKNGILDLSIDKKKKKESQIQNASRRTLWTILKIIGER